MSAGEDAREDASAPLREARPASRVGWLVEPPGIGRRAYDASCRSLLVLMTAVGLQLIALLMMAIGPLATLGADPATLTDAGRFFLSAEYDKEAYAIGCIATVLLGAGGVTAWNRRLHRIAPARRARVARRAVRAAGAAASLSTVAFAVVLHVASSHVSASGEVPTPDLLRLAAVPALTLAAIALGGLLLARAERGRVG